MSTERLRAAIGMAALAALVAGGRPAALSAQDSPGPAAGRADTLHIGLTDALARAVAANAGLEAAAQQAEAGDHAAAATARQRFGELAAVATTSRYSNAQILLPMSQQLLAGGMANLPFAQDQAHYGLTYSLPVFVGGKLVALGRLARLKAEEASALLEGSRWQLRANVATTYAGVQTVAAATAAYRAEVASLEQTHARIALMVSQGKRPEVDLLQVTDALEEARAQLAGAEAEGTQVRALLLALLDYPADQPATLDPLPDRLPALLPDSADWDGLVQAASPVTSARLRAEQATNATRAARADFLPQIRLGGSLWENAGTGVGPQQTWELTLQASMPLFTGGRRVAAYESARAAERAAHAALRQTQLRQQAELVGAQAHFRAAQVALDAAAKRVAAADEAARIEEVRYDNGAGTIEDMLRARTRAAAAEAFLARSKGDVLGAAAQLNALVEQEIVQ